jgi:hypothetical protein
MGTTAHSATLRTTRTTQRQRGRSRMCLSDAERKGISHTELEDAAGGDLVAFMAREIRKAVDEEVKRLAKEGP